MIMKTKTFFDQKMEDPEFAQMMAEESLILEVTEKIIELMEKENITKVELAKCLGKSKGFITQILNGSRNFTLKTIADIFHVLGYTLKIEEEKYDQDQEKDVCIIDFYKFQKKKVYNIPIDYDKTSLDLEVEIVA